jgi:hypothetical protein
MQENNRNFWPILIIALLACLCLCTVAVIGAGVYLFAQDWDGSFPVITIEPPNGDTPTPVVVIRTPVATSAVETADAVNNTNVPQVDPRALAERLKRIKDIPVVVSDTPPDYNVGD